MSTEISPGSDGALWTSVSPNMAVGAVGTVGTVGAAADAAAIKWTSVSPNMAFAVLDGEGNTGVSKGCIGPVGQKKAIYLSGLVLDFRRVNRSVFLPRNIPPHSPAMSNLKRKASDDGASATKKAKPAVKVSAWTRLSFGQPVPWHPVTFFDVFNFPPPITFSAGIPYLVERTRSCPLSPHTAPQSVPTSLGTTGVEIRFWVGRRDTRDTF